MGEYGDRIDFRCQRGLETRTPGFEATLDFTGENQLLFVVVEDSVVVSVVLNKQNFSKYECFATAEFGMLEREKGPVGSIGTT